MKPSSLLRQLVVETVDATTILRLDRPKAKNAMSSALLDSLHAYIYKLATQDPSINHPRVLIVSSTLPDVFCAGADLKERRGFQPHQTTQFLHKWNATLDLIEQLPIPTITAIQGLALGGGLETALSTDFRVVSPTAVLGLPESRLAIIPGAGGTRRLAPLIGYSRALDLILTGRRVDAQEALSLGLVNRVSEQGAEHGALSLAKAITDGGPLAIVAAKEAVRGQSRAWQNVGYRQVVDSQDKHEALAAFAEKRQPRFVGR